VELFLRLAALAPRVRLTSVEARSMGDGLHRVSCVVENIGYLPTYVLASARTLPWNEPLRVEIEPERGVEVCAGEPSRRVGHLEGWGGYDNWGTPVFARSWGGAVRRRVDWVVRGAGRVRIVAAGARVGAVEESVEVKG